MTINKIHLVHMITWFIYSIISLNWALYFLECQSFEEDTDGCTKQYMCAIEVYLLTVLSYLYGIIMDDKN